MMNEEEIRWIVENLFVGNRLAHGQAMLGNERIDLKNIRSPIIVFASHGDNITPPQQALNWIADTYRDVNEIKARGQRIVYLLHDSIGHLGIFVSGKIAGREHDAITDTMRAIEALPPGLYEMELEQGGDRIHIKFAPRTDRRHPAARRRPQGRRDVRRGRQDLGGRRGLLREPGPAVRAHGGE